MGVDKGLAAGSTTMLVLGLLKEKDRYGYEMMEELEKQSNHVFSLKAGTLYPILHQLEQQGMLESYEAAADGARLRKYYHLTKKGGKLLEEKKTEWETFSKAVNQVMGGLANAAV